MDLPPPGPAPEMDLPSLDPKPDNPSYPCPHADPEMVHKLAQLLLPGLAAVCVDSTTGDPFRSPASVAVDLRRDLIDLHLLPLSTSFVPTTLSLLSSPDTDLSAEDLPDLDSPEDILSYLLDQFSSSRRTVLGRLSSWLLSDFRDDKIDDFVHHLDLSSFWSQDRRETLAQTLLVNLDYKFAYHCRESFSDEKSLREHIASCPFRSVECGSDGCKTRVCRMHEGRHEGACPYRVLECEQGCGARVVRREMDRHCVTVCRMRTANCPFYQVGCRSAFAVCGVKDHCGERLREHLVMLLRVAGKEEGEAEELAELMEKSEFRDRLAGAVSVRALTSAVKNVEPKIPRPKKLDVDLKKDSDHGEQAEKEDADSKTKETDIDPNNDSPQSKQAQKEDVDPKTNPDIDLNNDSPQSKQTQKEDGDLKMKNLDISEQAREPDEDSKTKETDIDPNNDSPQSKQAQKEDVDPKTNPDIDLNNDSPQSKQTQKEDADSKMKNLDISEQAREPDEDSKKKKTLELDSDEDLKTKKPEEVLDRDSDHNEQDEKEDADLKTKKLENTDDHQSEQAVKEVDSKMKKLEVETDKDSHEAGEEA